LAEAKGGPRRVRAGQAIRVLDVPADTGQHGLFEALHGFHDARALADALKAAAGRYYGTAGVAWLELLAADPEGCAAAAREVIEAFAETHVPPGADGQVMRAAQRFALAAAAGELAAGAAILPWRPGEAERAAAACFAAWLEARQGGDGRAEDATAIAAVRRFLIAHGSSRFETVGTDDEASGERIANRAGWKKRVEGAWRFIIPGEVWRAEVVPGLDPEAAAAACRRAGYLIPQSEREPRNVRAERIGGRLIKAYVISETILGGEP
jgi:putative DNA primase/helicase